MGGRFNHAFFTASYTHSASKDDTQVYPTYVNPKHFYGPSNWDAPNRFSLAWNYQLPDYNGGRGLLGRIGSGWQVSGTTILQSGNPFNIYTSANFASGGDYNADGDNYDFPNVASYSQSNSRTAYRRGGTGTVSAANFTKPTPGTDGNEVFNSFRGPGFEQSDASLLKNTHISESVQFQLRFEFFNVLNHPNLTGVTTDQSNSNFGRTTGQATPRFLQVGGNLTF